MAGVMRAVLLASLRRMQWAYSCYIVLQEFAPLLSKAASTGSASKERPAVVANLSARVGSISDNSLGGWYSYR